MNRTTLSLLIGALVGLTILAAGFAGISLIRPGWLRALLAPAAAETDTPVIAPLPTEPGQPGVFSTATPAPRPTAGITPLPTAANGVCGGPEQMTIALLGVDERGGDYSIPTRTDAISLVNIRFTDKQAALLSIPRDLYVPLPNLEAAGIYQDRINTAFVHGEVYEVEGGGPAEFKQTVELNFGVRVHRYVMANFGAFVALVDALGGIDVDVPKDIYDPQFPTPDGGTEIFALPAGLQHLDGATALKYARTRHQDDDYRRIQRQQQVLLAIRDRLLRPEVIPQLPALINALSGAIRTDLTAEEIAALACVGPQIDRSAIGAYAITGEYIIPWTTPTGGRVSIPDRDAIAPLVQAFLGQ
ncbi:MAG: LCP family protein [Anaerolineales bacterium]|nr:LCP family protein [Anaerolineales bacterium]